jgi:hypothetical protein
VTRRERAHRPFRSVPDPREKEDGPRTTKAKANQRRAGRDDLCPSSDDEALPATIDDDAAQGSRNETRIKTGVRAGRSWWGWLEEFHADPFEREPGREERNGSMTTRAKANEGRADRDDVGRTSADGELSATSSDDAERAPRNRARIKTGVRAGICWLEKLNTDPFEKRPGRASTRARRARRARAAETLRRLTKGTGS